MKEILLFIYLACLVIITSEENTSCESLIKFNTKDYDLSTTIEKNFDLIRKDNNCIRSFISRGFTKSAEKYLLLLQKNKLSYKNMINDEINKVSQRLKEIYSKYLTSDSTSIEVLPAFKWAQSLSNIYIEIQFSHKHDVPGCLEVDNQNVTISNNNFIYLANCVLGDYPIRFNLTLPLLNNVTQEGSTVEPSSLGRVQITLKKNNSPEYWKTLLNQTVSEVNNNMKIWYDMKFKFSDELFEYEKEESPEIIEEKVQIRNRYKKKKNTKDISDPTLASQTLGSINNPYNS